MKVKVRYTLKNKEEENTLKAVGIKKDNELLFKDHDVIFKITLSHPIIIHRTSKEYELMMNFEAGKGFYKINDLGTCDLSLKTLDINLNDTDLYLKYDLTINGENSGIFELNLNYEVIE